MCIYKSITQIQTRIRVKSHTYVQRVAHTKKSCQTYKHSVSYTHSCKHMNTIHHHVKHQNTVRVPHIHISREYFMSHIYTIPEK